MLKTRVISGVIGVALLLLIAFTGKEIFAFCAFLVTLICLHEIFSSFEVKGYKPIRMVGYPSACLVLLPVFTNSLYINAPLLGNYFALGVFALLAFLFLIVIILGDKFNLLDIAITVFSSFYVCFLFSFLTMTRYLENGNVYIWLVFLGWSTDTFAYLIGRKFGKHKLVPKVSANKTLEGAFGGFFGCIATTAIFGIIANGYLERTLFLPKDLIILGILMGFFAQLGDLAASSVKRFTGVKDYGKIIPGHGGMLDRFDSIMFVAPVVYFYASIVLGG